MLNSKEIPTNSNKVDQDNLEIGTYPARVVQVLGLGLKPKSFDGEAQDPQPAISVTYELPEELLKDEEGNEVEGKPRWLSEDFPLYNLSSDLSTSSKRYKAIDTNMVHEGDWSKLIGMGCMVTVCHKKSKKNGKTYDNVGTVSPMRSKIEEKLPPLANPGKVFDPSEPDMEVFKSLPEYVQDKMTTALDFPGSKFDIALNGEGAVTKNEGPKVKEEADEGDEW